MTFALHTGERSPPKISPAPTSMFDGALAGEEPRRLRSRLSHRMSVRLMLLTLHLPAYIASRRASPLGWKPKVHRRWLWRIGVDHPFRPPWLIPPHKGVRLHAASTATQGETGTYAHKIWAGAGRAGQSPSTLGGAGLQALCSVTGSTTSVGREHDRVQGRQRWP